MEYTAEISIGLRRNPKESLLAALSRLTTLLDIPASANQILIKPSIYDPKLVGNTELELVRAITRTFSNLGHISIIESDNPFRTTKEAFEASGYSELVNENVELVNLSEIPLQPHKMAGHYFETLEMPSLLTKTNFFVNVPTLKLEPGICTIGGGIKNLFGLIPEPDKRQYHFRIDDVLLDILTAFRPQLTIMDLTTLVIGDREEGNTKDVGAVIVGTDPVSVDAFCSNLMGINPVEISHLKKAYDLGLGEIHVDRIKISGTEDQRAKLLELCTL
ncbi:MAG: DUF362 domain-containing protein [Candidatus Thorarchaeota archaeon]|nr:DUF362 domain-containing protein [Candidatus Thorarchaeota archaeon]